MRAVGNEFKTQSMTKARSLTLQIPHAALHSSLLAETWLAWQSMPNASKHEHKSQQKRHKYNAQRSMIWFLQMAQLSTTISAEPSAAARCTQTCITNPKPREIQHSTKKVTSVRRRRSQYQTRLLDFKALLSSFLAFSLLFLHWRSHINIHVGHFVRGKYCCGRGAQSRCVVTVTVPPSLLTPRSFLRHRTKIQQG